MLSDFIPKTQKIILLSLFFLLSTFSIFSQKTKKISTEDVWLKFSFYQSNIPDFQFTNDDEHLLFEDNSKLYTFSCKTLKIDDSIYHKSFDTLKISKTISSNTDKSFLLETNPKHIYRRSSLASYYYFDRKEMSITLLDKEKIRIPEFSPNDNLIVYFKDNNLFLRDKNETIRITNDGEKNRIINGAPDWVYEEELELTKAYWFSEDSKKLAYLKFDETNVKLYGIDTYNDPYPERYLFKYPKVGEDNSKVSIHIYEIETRNTINIPSFDNFEYTAEVTWLNNDVILVQKLNRFQDTLRIYSYNITSEESDLVYESLSNSYLSFPNNLTILDKSTFVILNDNNEYRNLYVINTENNNVEHINFSYDINKIVGIDKIHNRIHFLASAPTPMERQHFSVSYSGEDIVRHSKLTGTHEPNLSKNCTYNFDLISNELQDYSAIIQNIQTGEEQIIYTNTEQKEIDKEHNISYKEFFKITTERNDTLNAFIIKPANFKKNKKYPVLFYVYGGPLIQTVTKDYDYMLYWFNTLTQNGYIIVSVDPRGTGARGNDFNKCTQGKLGQLETDDIISSINYVNKLSFVDSTRIGMFGWSYGGYMTLMSMCLSDKIKAGISVAPITDWRFYDSIYTERYMKTTKENKDNYEKSSPLAYAKNLHGKLFLIHGSFDDNVHVQNSMQFAEKLIEQGIDFDFFIYPDKNHNISGGKTRYHLFNKINEFIFENL